MSNNLQKIEQGIITEINANFSKKILTFRILKDRAYTIVFKDFWTYSFKDAKIENEIFAIEEILNEDFLNREIDDLETTRIYGKTIKFKDLEEYEEVLKREGYNIYYIYSTTGLHGHIVAREVTIE